MSRDTCAECGSRRVKVFREGMWFCSRACATERVTSDGFRVLVLASKIRESSVIDTSDALGIIEAFVTEKMSSLPPAPPASESSSGTPVEQWKIDDTRRALEDCKSEPNEPGGDAR